MADIKRTVTTEWVVEDQATKNLQKIKRETEAASRATKDAQRNTSRLTNSYNKANKAVVGLSRGLKLLAGAYVAKELVQGAFRIGESAIEAARTRENAIRAMTNQELVLGRRNVADYDKIYGAIEKRVSESNKNQARSLGLLETELIRFQQSALEPLYDGFSDGAAFEQFSANALATAKALGATRDVVEELDKATRGALNERSAELIKLLGGSVEDVNKAFKRGGTRAVVKVYTELLESPQAKAARTKYLSSLDAQTNKLKNTVNDMMIKAGESLIPAIIPIISGLGQFLEANPDVIKDAISDIGRAIDGLEPAISTFKDMLVGLGLATGQRVAAETEYRTLRKSAREIGARALASGNIEAALKASEAESTMSMAEPGFWKRLFTPDYEAKLSQQNLEVARNLRDAQSLLQTLEAPVATTPVAPAETPQTSKSDSLVRELITALKAAGVGKVGPVEIKIDSRYATPNQIATVVVDKLSQISSAQIQPRSSRINSLM